MENIFLISCSKAHVRQGGILIKKSKSNGNKLNFSVKFANKIKIVCFCKKFLCGIKKISTDQRMMLIRILFNGSVWVGKD